MSEGKFKFRCLHCQNKLKAPVELVGERIRCPHCNSPIAIPNPGDVPEETASRQIKSMETESQKLKLNTSSAAIRAAEARQQIDDMNEAETCPLDREEMPDQAEEKIEPKVQSKKARSTTSTKSVKLTDSQKRLIKPKKKTFKIKKKK